MVKMMFLVYCKADVTREECQREWAGDQHLEVIPKLEARGLKRYVQNFVTSEEGDRIPDGIGELWFEDEAAMTRAVNSAEMAAGFEDLKRFGDGDKTVGLAVKERVVLE